MVKIRYTQELLGIMSFFTKITRVAPKDCFEDNFKTLTFVVPHDQLGRALGKKAANVKKLEKLLKRRLRLIGWHQEVIQFVRHLIHPLRPATVEEEGNIIYIKDNDKKTKSLLIGRNAQNLRNTEAIVQRYFSDITEIKVV
jgi:transcription termination/antitermination protein NusA